MNVIKKNSWTAYPLWRNWKNQENKNEIVLAASWYKTPFMMNSFFFFQIDCYKTQKIVVLKCSSKLLFLASVLSSFMKSAVNTLLWVGKKLLTALQIMDSLEIIMLKEKHWWFLLNWNWNVMNKNYKNTSFTNVVKSWGYPLCNP